MSEITDVMTIAVVTIAPEATMLEATETLVKHEITGLPVVDRNGKLLGIVSEKDLLILTYDLKAKLYDSTDGKKTVESIMTKDVITFDVDDKMSDVCKCLMENNFRRVPILSNGKMVGIVSRKDLLACRL